MVTNSHAIVQPWTVMVEALNTSIADGTVAGARCANDKAIGAHLTWMNLGQQIQKVVLSPQVAWVFS